MADVAEFKARARAMWSLGDYPEIAEHLTAGACDSLVDALDLAPGTTLLDVAAGTGNVAIRAAERGATVTASDLTPHLIEQGRARSESAGLDIAWQEADAEELPFEDGSFDVVTSALGVMFVPRPEVAMRELFRVVRPGGTIALASWTPTGVFSASLSVMLEAMPVAAAGANPTDWGSDERIRAWMAPYADEVHTEVRLAPQRFASVDDYVAFVDRNAPPVVAARGVLDDATWQRVHDATAAATAPFAVPTEDGVDVQAEYLLVVATKRGA